VLVSQSLRHVDELRLDELHKACAGSSTEVGRFPQGGPLGQVRHLELTEFYGCIVYVNGLV
jgi:hypothetical protein